MEAELTTEAADECTPKRESASSLNRSFLTFKLNFLGFQLLSLIWGELKIEEAIFSSFSVAQILSPFPLSLHEGQ